MNKAVNSNVGESGQPAFYNDHITPILRSQVIAAIKALESTVADLEQVLRDGAEGLLAEQMDENYKWLIQHDIEGLAGSIKQLGGSLVSICSGCDKNTDLNRRPQLDFIPCSERTCPNTHLRSPKSP